MRSTKGEQTRAAIAEAALRMFREQGYEATTMRAIAKEAGVATGNAYYYFDSKEELIQEYYARNQAEHAAACRPVLDTETTLGPRLRGVLRALIDVQAPYHAFAAKLYAEVIAGSRIRVPAVLRSRLARVPGLRSLTRRLLRVADDVLY